MVNFKNSLYIAGILVLTALVFMTVGFRPAWNDEGQYLDPGANLALGRGFVSSGWDSSAPGAHWGSSTPGFPLLFALVFKVFGFEIWAARSVFFCAHLVGSALMIRWADRTFGLSSGAKLGCLVAFLGAPAISYHALYHARLECFALLFCAWFLHLRDAWTSGSKAAVFMTALFGAIVLMMGLHFCAFFALAAAVSFLLAPSWGKLRYGLVLATGMLIGLLAIRIAYGHYGVWDDFIAHRTAHFGRTLPWSPSGVQRFYVTKDLGIYGVACILVLAWELLMRRDKLWNARSAALGWASAAFVGMPIFMSTVGIWHAGYAWMAALPMVLATACLFKEPVSLPIKALAVLGLLLSFAGAAREIRKIPDGVRELSQREQAVAMLLAEAKPGEAVASTFEFFYEVRKLDRDVYFRVEKANHLSLGFPQSLYFPETAKARTQWLLTCEAETPWYLEGLGGEWIEVRRYPRNDLKGDYQLFRRRQPAGQ